MYEIVEAHILLALSVVHIKTPDAVMMSGGIRDEIRAARRDAYAQVEVYSLFNKTVVNACGKTPRIPPPTSTIPVMLFLRQTENCRYYITHRLLSQKRYAKSWNIIGILNCNIQPRRFCLYNTLYLACVRSELHKFSADKSQESGIVTDIVKSLNLL